MKERYCQAQPGLVMGVKISANSPLRHSEMAASKQIGNQKGGPPDVSGSFKTQGKRQRAPLSVCEVGNLFDGRAAHRHGHDFGTCGGSARWKDVLLSRPLAAGMRGGMLRLLLAEAV